MNPIEHIRGFHDQLTAWRRDFHAHPETGFEEQGAMDAVLTRRVERKEVHHAAGLAPGHGFGQLHQPISFHVDASLSLRNFSVDHASCSAWLRASASSRRLRSSSAC